MVRFLQLLSFIRHYDVYCSETRTFKTNLHYEDTYAHDNLPL